MPHLGASAPWETALVLSMALLSCCDRHSGPELAARRDAAQTVTAQRDAALRGVTPLGKMPRDAMPKATAHLDAMPKAAATASRDATPRVTGAK